MSIDQTAPRRAPNRPIITAATEPLERRILRAATLDGSVLNVVGTSGNDQIAVFLNATDHSKIDVTINGDTKEFTAAAVSRIKIDGLAGNDSEAVRPGVAITTKMYGGAGD